MIQLRNKIFRISLPVGILFSVFSAPVFSQVAQDSIANDSTNRAFMKQVISNQKALGLDTTIYTKALNDTSGSSQPKKKAKTAATGRFHWNDSKARADTLSGKKIHRHSALYAALFSMAVPGLGQAYNKKYWKIPIVYAGFGGLGYALYYTGTNFYGYRNAYRLEADLDPNTQGSFQGEDDKSTLKAYRDYFKRNLDITAICTGVWYVLNIIDAAVDAHLFEWNMRDDLNISWQPAAFPPQFNYTQTAGGIKVFLNF